MAEEQGNIKQEYTNATIGLNQDQTLNQIKQGTLTYALNAALENFDANSVNYQNEQGNEFCVDFPEGFALIGHHFIIEKNKHIFFLTNPLTGECHLGYMDNNDCVYRIYIDDPCLGWDVRYPIHKIVHRITNCNTEIYWPDNVARRYLDIDNIPRRQDVNSTLCDPVTLDNLLVDCNRLLLQPNFSIPELNVIDIISGGDLTAGTVQFAAQYSDASGNPFTSYYSVTNPTPIANKQLVTNNFNDPVGKSVVVNVSNLDTSGQFQYFNLAVIKTINNIPSVELVGTYFIEDYYRKITYTGQQKTNIKLSMNDIFEKFPYYELADDITAVQDILVWKGMTNIDRINYQSIATEIDLQWQTYRIPANEDYSNELNATNLRGYLRDEVYALEIAFLLDNGKQTDGFHIPGRMMNFNEISKSDVPNTNPDFIGEGTSAPYWRIYNTATDLGPASGDPIGNATPHRYGDFAYWESEEEYSCNDDIWGSLAGQKIRHHKFPDVLVSPIMESAPFEGTANMTIQRDAVFPIGIKVDPDQIKLLIERSSLSQAQKDAIVGFKIIRGNRSTNKSIVAKGILRNVGKYEKEKQTYYYPNYPYNDISPDPFLFDKSNSYSDQERAWFIQCRATGTYEYTSNITGNRITGAVMEKDKNYEFMSLTRPIITSGEAFYGPASYDVVNVIGCLIGLGDTNPLQSYPFYAEWESEWVLSTSITPTTVYSQYISPIGSPSGCSDPTDPGYANTTLGYGTCQKVPIGQLVNSSPGGICKPQFIVPPPEEPMPLTVITDKKISRRSILETDKKPAPLDSFKTDTSDRQIFNSPETSFGQPFLGDILKLESLIYGRGKAHFVEVKDNAKYKLLTAEAQKDALDSSNDIGAITTDPFNAVAMFTAYQAYLAIYINGITRKNYAYSYNSRASYDYTTPMPNDQGIKQRNLDVANYLIPTVQSVGEDNGILINNYQRETSVYLKTKDVTPILLPKDAITIASEGSVAVEDKSRTTISISGGCDAPQKELDISVLSYYASLKNQFVNQWGQIYSYETIDTGYQYIFNSKTVYPSVVFGGDTFISRFAFKTKLPFFFDNRVNAPDDSDIFYDEIGNVAYPQYWHSARSILEDYTTKNSKLMRNVVSYKAHNFDCKNSPVRKGGTASSFYDGYFYLFAYGIPNFYCESSYNTDLRQAFNNKEGDFWPHVSTGIPDDWVQESFVSIANDNTYTYNITYSKQNKENTFTHLPPDYDGKACFTNYPFRAVYSDPQNIDSDNRVNSWLTYRAVSYFDFPQNYGELTSIDGIQNSAILARFHNKSLMYGNLLTIDTSNPQAAYIGNPTLFKGAPPIDFAETDLGYVGSQNKFLLKIPQGQITIDAKRGQVFLISGTQVTDLSQFGSGLNRFFTDHLAFEILRWFPEVNTDNHFNGVGLHGVYDSKFDRVIISKLDYVPIDTRIQYDTNTQEFYIEETINSLTLKTVVDLKDPTYFCSKSWTLSYNVNTQRWISFHSYIPNYYIAENNFFYSGLNGCCTEFDFIAGSIVANTTTTTTTTIFVPDCIPLFGNASIIYPIDCDLYGEVVITDCELEGTGIITVPSPPPPCYRPEGLDTFLLINGYTIDAVPVFVDITATEVSACLGRTNIITLSGLSIETVTVDAFDLNVLSQVYISDGSDSCVGIPDGWYLTGDSVTSGTVIYIENNLVSVISNCVPTTTTTSSTSTTTSTSSTTTTSTSSTSSTTTTTTTVAPICYSYQASTYGLATSVTWNDCDNIPQMQTLGGVGGYDMFAFCAISITDPGTADITLIGIC